jgi:hypothetical protein
MKTALSKDELGAKVLEAIREQPGCRMVKEISVSRASGTNVADTWIITVVDSGGALISDAFRAARLVQSELRQHFDLRVTP